MPMHTSQDETRQPVQQANAEVEKLYESCCGSCGSPSPTTPTTPAVTLEILTSVPNGTEPVNGPSKP